MKKIGLSENKLVIFLITIFPLVLSINIVFAQSGRVFGTVTDEAGNPLNNVKVIILCPGMNIKITTATNSRGRYLTRQLYSAVYEISFELEGYLKVGKRIRLGFFKPYMLNVTMANLNHFKEGNYKAAIESFKKVTERLPDCFEAFYHLGLSYLMNDDTDSAIDALKRAKEINSENVMVYISLGECYVKNGLMDKAGEAFSQAITLRPENVKIYNIIGSLYYKYDKIDEAIAAFQKSVEINPLSSSTYYRLGRVYVKKRDAEKSIANFERFLQLEPKDPKASWIKAMVEELKKLSNEDKK